MTTTIESEPLTTKSSAGHRLRQRMAAVRVSFTWLGVRKSLTTAQKAQAAESFGAEGKYLSAGKKLLDTRHPAFRAVTAIRGAIQNYWRGVSVPYPEPGLRLIRQDRIATFDHQLHDYRDDLQDAVHELQQEYGEIREAAKHRLGELYCVSDYPDSLTDMFAVEWDFPSVEPPDYLRQLSPEIYEQERARITARFDEAVRLAEEAFTSELARLVSHLTERLAGTEDGQPKVFRDTAVTRLQEFFTRFQSLSIHSDVELDRLVEQAQSILTGVAPQALRETPNLRQHVATQLSVVQSALDGLMVNRPRRAIIRPSRPEEE
ncbi:MAG: hypothetical protein U0941_29115 [Planctomycetaceae bacterium]